MAKGYRMVVFDMDGVLISYASSWSWVHDKFGVNNDEALELFRKGEMDEDEFIRRDIKLWTDKHPNMKIKEIINALHDVPLVGGIQETVATLKDNGIISVIVSGGIDLAAKMIENEFGFDASSGNMILTDSDGALTGHGRVNVDLTDKGKKTREFMKLYGISKEETVAVGNSYTDIKMFECAGLSIAFNPIDERVVNAADVVLKSNNISDILGLILKIENGI